MVLVWCLYGARHFFYMGVLVFGKVTNLYVIFTIYTINDDKFFRFQLIQQSPNIALIIRQYLCPNFPLSKFKPTFAVRKTPETGKKYPRQGIAIREVLIFEKAGFNITSTHFDPPPEL
jgi:hypothetical protein